MQKAEEAASEAEAQSRRRLGIERQRRIVQPQLLEGILQVAVSRAVHRIDSAEHHLLYALVSDEGLGCGIVRQSYRIARSGVTYILYRSADVSNLACLKTFRGYEFARREETELRYRELLARVHRADPVALPERAFLNAHADDDALVRVILGVENKCLQRRVRIRIRCGQILDDLLEHFVYIDVALGRDQRCVGCVYSDIVFYLAADLFGARGRKVDLVYYGKHLEVGINGQIHISQCLRLYSLR